MLSDIILKLIHHWIYFIMIPSFVKKNSNKMFFFFLAIAVKIIAKYELKKDDL